MIKSSNFLIPLHVSKRLVTSVFDIVAKLGLSSPVVALNCGIVAVEFTSFLISKYRESI